MRANPEIPAYLIDLIEKVNGDVLDKDALMVQRIANWTAAKGPKDRVLKEVLNDAADSAQEWARFRRSEAAGALASLRYLGRLPDDGTVDELLDACRAVRYETRTGVRSGVPFVEAVAIVPDSAKVAYALVQLANEPAHRIRVMSCKYCHEFFLTVAGKKGKPRQFCSLKHTNAYGKREYDKRERLKKLERERSKKRKLAAKHK